MIRWTTLFLDVAAEHLDEAARFWAAVQGAELSPWRRRTFATFLPASGDATVRIQRVDTGPGGTHLDLHVDVPLPEAAAGLVALGATVTRTEDDVIVLRSPGGYAFCVVPSDGETTPPGPVASAAGPTRLDQLCLDVPPDAYETECRFWASATGRAAEPGALPDFRRIPSASGFPTRLLLQRRVEAAAGDVVEGHVDLAVGPAREAVAPAHLSLGARVDAVQPFWTVMRDPAGHVYCLTPRDPVTGDRSTST